MALTFNLRFIDLLYSIKQFIRNNGWMTVGDDLPFGFIALCLIHTELITLNFAVNSVSQIHGVIGDFSNGSRTPFCSCKSGVLIVTSHITKLAGRNATALSQFLCNRIESHSFSSHGEDFFHYKRRFGVDIESIFLGISEIPIRDTAGGRKVFTAVHLGGDTGTNSYRGILCVSIVDNHLERQQKSFDIRIGLFAVIIIVDADKTNAHQRECSLKEFACRKVLSAKTGDILYDYAVHTPTGDCIIHFDETGALIAHAAESMIGKNIDNGHVFLVCKVCETKFLLVANRVLFNVVSILNGETKIYCYFPSSTGFQFKSRYFAEFTSSCHQLTSCLLFTSAASSA